MSKQENKTEKRGFASMDKKKQHEIALKGGRSSAEKAGHEGMSERGRKVGHAGHETIPEKNYEDEDTSSEEE